MSIRVVVKMGNQQLATPSEPILDLSASRIELLELIDDMTDTMRNEGGVGLAAPQIGCNKRVIIFGFEQNQRYPNEQGVPFTVLINPVITALSSEMNDAWEGCLSVPGLRGLVPRHTHIEYKGYDVTGQLITRVVDGFHARVVQHEYDHLDGILYPERLKSLRFFGFEDELTDW